MAKWLNGYKVKLSQRLKLAFKSAYIQQSFIWSRLGLNQISDTLTVLFVYLKCLSLTKNNFKLYTSKILVPISNQISAVKKAFCVNSYFHRKT